MRILIVEDQSKMGEALYRGLCELGHDADLVPDGEQAGTRARAVNYDLVLMDAMLPDALGTDVCRQLRREGNDALMVVMTALPAGERAAIAAQGAADGSVDGVLAKPFELNDLLALTARLQGRRARREVEQQGALLLDLDVGELRGPKGKARLSSKELDLLRVLWDAAGQAIDSEELARAAWGVELDSVRQAIEVYGERLAAKLDRVSAEPGTLVRASDGALRLEIR